MPKPVFRKRKPKFRIRKSKLYFKFCNSNSGSTVGILAPRGSRSSFFGCSSQLCHFGLGLEVDADEVSLGSPGIATDLAVQAVVKTTAGKQALGGRRSSFSVRRSRSAILGVIWEWEQTFRRSTTPARTRPEARATGISGARRSFFGNFGPRVGERVRKFGFSAGNSSSGSRASSRASRSTAGKLSRSRTEKRRVGRESGEESGGEKRRARRELRATKTSGEGKPRTCRGYLRGDGCKGVN